MKLQDKFEDNKGVIRIRKLKKNRQHDGQKKKAQRDRQRSKKHTHKTKDGVARTPLKTRDEPICLERVAADPAPLVAHVVLL